MKLATFLLNHQQRAGILRSGEVLPFPVSVATSIDQVLLKLGQGETIQQLCKCLEPAVKVNRVKLLPPLTKPSKLLCVDLKYLDGTFASDSSDGSDHAAIGLPTLFLRLSSNLASHRAPIERQLGSDRLDFEGELAVIIGKGGKNIAKGQALNHVFGYSIFNKGSVRTQCEAPQWTVSEVFNQTGGFGPAIVTVDELPEGAKGLHFETRVNGKVVQSCNTDDMVFDVATLIHVISKALALSPGDVIVAGTPLGAGRGKSNGLYMRRGDLCEVSIEGIGTLQNQIETEENDESQVMY